MVLIKLYEDKYRLWIGILYIYQMQNKLFTIYS